MIRYAILDATTRAGHAARLAADGIDYIQLRAKALPTGDLLTLARSIVVELAGTPTKLLLNARADIALAAGAHGVHLTSAPDELTPHQIRTLYTSVLHPPSLIPCTSISCHTLDDVTRARSIGADLILFGPVFEKRVAQQFITDGSGLTTLAAAVSTAAGIPVLALGGITAENIDACLAAGAAGIAAIRLFA